MLTFIQLKFSLAMPYACVCIIGFWWQSKRNPQKNMSQQPQESQPQQPQIKVKDILYEVEFGIVSRKKGHYVTIYCSRLNTTIERAYSNVVKIRCQDGYPAFVTGCAGWPRLGTQVVYAPSLLLWGYKDSFEAAQEQQRRRGTFSAPIPPVAVKSDLAFPIFTPEEERDFGKRQVDKYCRRYPHGVAPTVTTATIL